MRKSLAEALDREPFAPFSIVTTSGERFEVGNPELLVLFERFVRYYMPRSDAYTDINMIHIALIEVQSVLA